jgi:GntR family transcriptional regulator
MKNFTSINKDSSTPLYIQVAESIAAYIKNSRLKDGDPLPSQNELIKHFNVSQVTIRLALQRLKTEGMITRVQGKGTYVSDPTIHEQILGVQSIEERLAEQGIEVENRFVEAVETIPADKIRLDLGLKKGVRSFKIRRLKLTNDSILALETRHLPKKISSRFRSEELKVIPFVSLFERHEDTKIHRIQLHTRAESALALEAEILETPVDTPLLVTYGVYFNSTNQPLMAGRITYLAHKIELGYEVHRKEAHPLKFITYI